MSDEHAICMAPSPVESRPDSFTRCEQHQGCRGVSRRISVGRVSFAWPEKGVALEPASTFRDTEIQKQKAIPKEIQQTLESNLGIIAASFSLKTPRLLDSHEN